MSFKFLDHVFQAARKTQVLQDHCKINFKMTSIEADGIEKTDNLGIFSSSLSSDQIYIILKRCGHEGIEDLNSIPPEASYIIEKVEQMSTDDGLKILKKAIKDHDDDVNYPEEDFNNLIKLVELNEKYKEDDHSNDGSIDEQVVLNEKDVMNKNDTTIIQTEISHHDLEIDNSLSDYGNYNSWAFSVKLESVLIHYYSPYPEVRAVTDPIDDPSIPVETIRSYTLAFIWIIIGSGINEFFYHRQPSITITTAVIQLLLYPCGKLWELSVPDWGFKIRNKRISLNPGPFTSKEMMFITICYSIASTPAFVDSNIIVQKLYYKNTWANWGFQILLILSTQCMGVGLSGILRKICVFNPRSLWPTILPTIALNRALLKPEVKETINGWLISKYRFFFYTCLFSFCYFWLPNYLFTALSTFDWLTWIAPNNFNLAVVCGSTVGMGVNPIPSFDWNILDYNYALSIPFYSQVNQYIGTVIGTFCVLALYYTNYKWTSYMPINDESVFKNTGEYYDVTEVINSKSQFDQASYDKVGPPFYTAGNLITYGAYFCIYVNFFLYSCYNDWKTIKVGMLQSYNSFASSFKNLKAKYITKDPNYVKIKTSVYDGFDDPHTTMMKQYKEIPDTYYLIILLISLVFMILCVKLYPADTPVWTVFFAIAISFVFLVPFSILLSTTGYTLGINVLVELIIGYAVPGSGLALNTIKALATNIGTNSDAFVHSLKLGHYVKINPMAVFRGQLFSIILQAFVTLCVLNFEINHIKDFCQSDQAQKLSCPQDNIFYAASILWGTIGPKKVFSEEFYPIFKWCFLIGFLLVFPCILFKKYAPRKYSAYFEPTLIIGGMLNFAPYNLSYYTGGLYLSFAFMFYIKRHYTAWWEKYTYVFSSAMGTGVATSAVIIFFAVQYEGTTVNWWGNNVNSKGVEGSVGRIALIDASKAPGGYFGPRKGHFP